MPAPQTEVLITVDGVGHARHVLMPGDYIIGRSADCHLRIEADLVSRQHAMLVINYDHALIEDLGSSNGTSVNGQPVTARTRLWPNQKIQIGTATIELRRLQGGQPEDMSLAPAQRAVRDMLPAEMLREKKYDIGAVVVRGGMGAILDAREAAIERKVAMKVMLDTNDAGDIARFIGEAKVTGQLEHPNIVPVHELGVDENGQPFYTMKMVQGITLKKVLDLMAAGTATTIAKYPLAALLTVFQKVCDALAFAHSKGVIHRDLKPENLMLGDYGEVLVMDWGLAKRLRIADCGLRNEEAGTQAGEAHADRHTLAPGSEQSAIPNPQSAIEATLDGTIMGTPQFMSPEQARGEIERIDARSDIYSLGAILYQILALRASVTGTAAMEIVGKVGRGEIEPLQSLAPSRKDAKEDRGGASKSSPLASSRLGASHIPGARIPDSLAAVVRKAMSLGRTGRYQTVADLQRDIEAYQGGFATSAENAGKWKLFTLFVRRNKAASIGTAALLLVSIGFMAKVITEGRRAERGEAKANAALADLKASAPALLQLAESEADSQRLASALGKLDAALALDPALLRARWQRAWVLLALERWSEAADALRLAQQHDPGSQASRLTRQTGVPPVADDRRPEARVPDQAGSLISAVEKVAAAPEAGRWKSDAAREVFAHLQTVEATGPMVVFASKLALKGEERRKFADQRLLTAIGKGTYAAQLQKDGTVRVNLTALSIRSLEPLRGLPIDHLSARRTLVADLEPLRGLRLQSLDVGDTKITDLSPLRGMPLRSLNIDMTLVSDLSPLEGMPLTALEIGYTSVTRLDALRGMPLTKFSAGHTGLVDCSPLKGAPIETLNLGTTRVVDLSFVQGMPLREINIGNGPFRNLAALRGLPLEGLHLVNTPITDLSPLERAPLKDLDLRACGQLKDFSVILTLPRLNRLTCSVLPAALLPLRESKTLKVIEADAYPGEGSQGTRPVAEFWRAYDAHQAAQKK